MLLLRMSGVPRLQYLLRTVHPSLIDDTAGAFDSKVMAAAWAKLGIGQSELDGAKAAGIQATLPVSDGGLGLRSQRAAAPAAWLSSIASCADVLADHFGSPPSQLLEWIEDAIDRVKASISPEDLPKLADRIPLNPSRLLRAFTADRDGKEPERATAGLQRKLTELIDNAQVQRLGQEAGTAAAGTDGSARDIAARLFSCTAPGTSTLLTTLPAMDLGPIPDAAFTLNLRMRLGLAPVTAILPRTCYLCAADVTKDPYHALSCNKLKTDATARHNAIEGILQKVGRFAGLGVQSQPRHVIPREDIIPDLLITSAELREQCLVDVVVSHPTAPSHRHAAAKGALQVARGAEARKAEQYRNGAEVAGYQFLAFSVETFGGIGEEARAVVDFICTHAAQDVMSPWDPEDIRRYLYQSIATAIAVGNWHIMRKWLLANRIDGHCTSSHNDHPHLLDRL